MSRISGLSAKVPLWVAFVLFSSCASQQPREQERAVASTGRASGFLQIAFQEGTRFRGVDEKGKACVMEVTDIRNQGDQSHVRVKISFAKKANFDLNHPSLTLITGEAKADEGVLRGFPGPRSGARGELRVYLDRQQRPSFLTYYPGVPLRNPAVSAKRFCEDLVEVR